jgi:hypothetical protein
MRLVDPSNEKTIIRFDLGDPGGADLAADAPLAEASADALRVALMAITDANLLEDSLSVGLANGASVLPAGDFKITTEAVLSVYLSQPTAIPKFGTLRVPSPSSSIFEADGITVDKANGDVQTFVSAVANNALISDDESIVLASGVNGVQSGFTRTKARRYDGK